MKRRPTIFDWFDAIRDHPITKALDGNVTSRRNEAADKSPAREPRDGVADPQAL